jgi:hypothetical protein
MTPAGSFRFSIVQDDGQPTPRELHCDTRAICAQSLELRSLIDENQAVGVASLTPDPGLDIDCAALLFLVENLSSDDAQVVAMGVVEPRFLTKTCNALWKYQCNPQRFIGLWDDVDPNLASQALSLENGKQKVVRCWRRGTRTDSNSLYLVNIAVVLGKHLSHLDNILKGDIFRAVVWDSKKDFRTSVSKLRDIQGKPAYAWVVSASTNFCLAIRTEEMRKVFLYIQNALLALSENHSKTAKWIRETLKENLDVNFYKGFEANEPTLANYSVYEFLMLVEDILVPRHGHQRNGSRSNNAAGRHKPKHGPTIDWGSKIDAVLEVFSPHQRDEAETVLGEVEEFVLHRQTLLATELIEWRDETLMRWIKDLGGTESTANSQARLSSHRTSSGSSFD